MFLHIGIDALGAHIQTGAATLGAHDQVAHIPKKAIGILAAMARKAYSVGIHEFGKHVIVDVPVQFVARAPSRSPRCHDFDGVRSHNPVDEIDIVEVLFDDLVAANPDKGVPITVLPFHVAPLGVARVGVKNGAAQVIRVERDDVADGAVVDFIDGLDIFALGVPLRPGHDGQLFLFGFLGRGLG